MNTWRVTVFSVLGLQAFLCCSLLCNMMGIASVRDWTAYWGLQAIAVVALVVCAIAKDFLAVCVILYFFWCMFDRAAQAWENTRRPTCKHCQDNTED